jgi:hypothetical protein
MADNATPRTHPALDSTTLSLYRTTATLAPETKVCRRAVRCGALRAHVRDTLSGPTRRSQLRLLPLVFLEELAVELQRRPDDADLARYVRALLKAGVAHCTAAKYEESKLSAG